MKWRHRSYHWLNNILHEYTYVCGNINSKLIIKTITNGYLLKIFNYNLLDEIFFRHYSPLDVFRSHFALQYILVKGPTYLPFKYNFASLIRPRIVLKLPIYILIIYNRPRSPTALRQFEPKKFLVLYQHS